MFKYVLAGINVCSHVLFRFLISYSLCLVPVCVCRSAMCVCACLLFMKKGMPGLCSVQYIKVFIYNIVYVSLSVCMCVSFMEEYGNFQSCGLSLILYSVFTSWALIMEYGEREEEMRGRDRESEREIMIRE